MIGETLGGRYQVVRLLGQGGMGSVYEARHRGTGRRVAVKVLAAELLQHPDAIGRFQLEAQAAGAIESLHIAQVLDVGVDPRLGVPFLVMEHLVGEDLERASARLGALSADLVIRVGAQACLGLSRAHAAGIVHRDIKPANIFLTERDGGELIVKLLDFGIAKLRPTDAPGADGHKLTRTGTLLGSPLYMSPEQVQGEKTIDARTDLWSLGVTLYEALSGRTPHHDVETVGKLLITICTAPPPPLQTVAPGVPRALAAIIDRALRIDPGQRFQSAREMLEALRRLAPEGITIPAAMLATAPGALDATSLSQQTSRRVELSGSTAAISSESRTAAMPGTAAMRLLAYGAGAALVLGLAAVGYRAAHPASGIAKETSVAPASSVAPTPPAPPAPSSTAPSSPASAPSITPQVAAVSSASAAPPVPSAAPPAKTPAPRASAAPLKKAPLFHDPTSQM